MKETFAKPHVTENEEENDYTRYVKEIQNLQMPCHWRGAFKLSSSKKFVVVKTLLYKIQDCNSKKNNSENYWTIENIKNELKI